MSLACAAAVNAVAREVFLKDAAHLSRGNTIKTRKWMREIEGRQGCEEAYTRLQADTGELAWRLEREQ